MAFVGELGGTDGGGACLYIYVRECCTHYGTGTAGGGWKRGRRGSTETPVEAGDASRVCCHLPMYAVTFIVCCALSQGLLGWFLARAGACACWYGSRRSLETIGL